MLAVIEESRVFLEEWKIQKAKRSA